MVATNSVGPAHRQCISAGTSMLQWSCWKSRSPRLPRDRHGHDPQRRGWPWSTATTARSDLNAWGQPAGRARRSAGLRSIKGTLFTKLFNASLRGAPDCGGVTPVNYFSGESVTHFDAGLPLLLRRPDADFTLANFMRANIYSAFATLAMGLEILKNEDVAVDTLLGHGGLFKTPGVAQRYLAAAAAGAPSPAWRRRARAVPTAWPCLQPTACTAPRGETLADYLKTRVFAGARSTTLTPDAADVAGFAAFLRGSTSGHSRQSGRWSEVSGPLNECPLHKHPRPLHTVGTEVFSYELS